MKTLKLQHSQAAASGWRGVVMTQAAEGRTTEGRIDLPL